MSEISYFLLKTYQKRTKNVPEKIYAISDKTRYYNRFSSYSIEIHPISNVTKTFYMDVSMTVEYDDAWRCA